MESGNYLREAITRLKGKKYSNLSELAQKANINQGNLSAFMKEEGEPGRRETMTFDSAWKILNALGMPLPPLDAPSPSIRRVNASAPVEKVAGPGLKTINVYAVAGAGPAVAVNDLEPLFQVTAPPDYFRRSDYAIVVDGHSMEPLIAHGSIVGVKLHASFVANELYVARIPYEGLVIKRVGVDRTANEFVFKSENPNKENYPDFRLNIDEAEGIIVGRVVWVMWGY